MFHLCKSSLVSQHIDVTSSASSCRSFSVNHLAHMRSHCKLRRRHILPPLQSPLFERGKSAAHHRRGSDTVVQYLGPVTGLPRDGVSCVLPSHSGEKSERLKRCKHCRKTVPYFTSLRECRWRLYAEAAVPVRLAELVAVRSRSLGSRTAAG